LRELAGELRIPGLGRFGVAGEHVAGLVQRAKLASSMRANPVALDDDALGECLRRAL
jgi:alcohol dehydrogenase class IV